MRLDRPRFSGSWVPFDIDPNSSKLSKARVRHSPRSGSSSDLQRYGAWMGSDVCTIVTPPCTPIEYGVARGSGCTAGAKTTSLLPSAALGNEFVGIEPRRNTEVLWPLGVSQQRVCRSQRKSEHRVVVATAFWVCECLGPRPHSAHSYFFPPPVSTV